MNRTRKGMIAAAVLAALSTVAYAAGNFETLPIIGGASFCAATNSNGPGVGGTTGQTGTTGTCALTVPAGPPTFTGNEIVPVDTGAQNPSSAVVGISQLGQGPMVDLTTVATSQTIPNNTPWYFLDGAQASAFTVTMPSAPVEGQIQRIVCEAATVGALTVAANTGQTVKFNPSAACVAGTAYAYRYQASNTTWYKF